MELRRGALPYSPAALRGRHGLGGPALHRPFFVSGHGGAGRPPLPAVAGLGRRAALGGVHRLPLLAAHEAQAYCPRNVGALFSRNARTPSWASAVPSTAMKSRASAASPSARGTLKAWSTLALAKASARVAPWARPPTYSSTRCGN